MNRYFSEFLRKNKDDLRALFTGSYPEFVYKNSNLKNKIPVFTFHSVDKEKFELQCKFLAENNYQTLNAEEFYNYLTEKESETYKTIVLTFDDGLASLWSIAFPVLKKYNLKAISFIIPSYIIDSNEIYPTIENRNVSYEELKKRERDIPFCTWEEIKIMHRSGLVDFQSHSYSHSTVFSDSKLLGFVNPSFKPFFLNDGLSPLINNEDGDKQAEYLEFGFPLYESASNLAAEKRFVENNYISKECIDFVKKNGGINFFLKNGWEKILYKFHNSLLNEHKPGYFQSIEKRKENIRLEFAKSKNIIEEKLDKNVEHLSYPWYYGSKMSVEISEEIGYKSNYWGIIGNDTINKVGDNPYFIKRINEKYILRLPGKNRKKLLNVLINRIIN